MLGVRRAGVGPVMSWTRWHDAGLIVFGLLAGEARHAWMLRRNPHMRLLKKHGVGRRG